MWFDLHHGWTVRACGDLTYLPAELAATLAAVNGAAVLNQLPAALRGVVPIIEGAGGIVTNWEGGPAAQGGRIVAAGDPRAHEEAMRLLAQ